MVAENGSLKTRVDKEKMSIFNPSNILIVCFVCKIELKVWSLKIKLQLTFIFLYFCNREKVSHRSDRKFHKNKKQPNSNIQNIKNLITFVLPQVYQYIFWHLFCDVPLRLRNYHRCCRIYKAFLSVHLRCMK